MIEEIIDQRIKGLEQAIHHNVRLMHTMDKVTDIAEINLTLIGVQAALDAMKDKREAWIMTWTMAMEEEE